MSDRDYILAPASPALRVSVALEPDTNILNSLLLLSHPEQRSGFADWVTRTSAALSPERAHRHQMVVEAMFGALEANLGHPSFPAYLDALERVSPETLLEQVTHVLCEKGMGGSTPLDKETLLHDRQAYLTYVEQLYAEKGVKEELFKAEDFIEAHALFQDPPEMKRVIVSHLRVMWEEYVRPEWERSLPMLQEAVEAFQEVDFSHKTALEALRVVTGRDMTGIWEEWPETLTFIPSAHIGPYITRLERDGVARIIFGARLPEGTRVKSPSLSRSELLVRLSAVADDTRLQILELLTQHEELCAQDIIRLLDLSQSAASRHLRQLTATGFLVERRNEVAKCYRINPQRVDDTLRALKRFLRAR